MAVTRPPMERVCPQAIALFARTEQPENIMDLPVVTVVKDSSGEVSGKTTRTLAGE